MNKTESEVVTMSGYVFVSNSTKPTEEKQKSREPIKLENVNRPCLQTALEMDYDVYFGVNRENPKNIDCELPVHLYDSHTYRSITAFSDNRVAYQNLAKVIKEGDVDVIHCNTPVGGMIGRLAGKRYHVKKVIYTAHGFHFYKGAPLINRTVFKWAEQVMAHWTDAIITMNEEDYQSALKFRLRKGGKVYKVHGVGITLDEFNNIHVDKRTKRSELGLKRTDIVCISAGDLVARKNYSIAIKALAKVKNNNLHYLICGVGPEKEKLEKLAVEYGVSDRVHFLGFRSDVKELMKISDIFLFTTLQEGMPRSMMEAMACGLPCVASKIRGNVDLLVEGKGGYLREASDSEEMAQCLRCLAEDSNLRKKMSEYNLKTIKRFDVKVVKKEIEQIYKEVLGED